MLSQRTEIDRLLTDCRDRQHVNVNASKAIRDSKLKLSQKLKEPEILEVRFLGAVVYKRHVQKFVLHAFQS
jgi:hypothetical protein